MRIVSQAIRSANGEAYQRGVAQARRGLEAAMAAQLPADASFADRERAVLAAANEVCRRILEAELQATTQAHPDRVQIELTHARDFGRQLQLLLA